MSRYNSAAWIARPEGNYAQAYEVWQRALENYLQLAREEASASKLRAAAAAVHAAALRKGRLASPTHDRRR